MEERRKHHHFRSLRQSSSLSTILSDDYFPQHQSFLHFMSSCRSESSNIS